MHITFIHYLKIHFRIISANLVSTLKSVVDQNLKISVLCMDSIEKSYAAQQELRYENVKFYDISEIKNYHYKLRSFIEKIKPDLIVMYDDAFLLNAAIINVSRKLCIPTLYIQHGVFSDKPKKKKFKLNTYMRKIRRYSKYLKIYKNTAGISALFSPKFMKKLVKMIFYNESILPTTILNDFHCDYAAVWGEYFKKISVIRKGYDKDKVYIVGSPDFSRDSNILVKWSSKSKKILYIAQPLVEDKIISYDKYKNWASNFINTFPKNLEILIKPHPRNDPKLLRKVFGDLIYLNENPVNVIDIYSAFSHFSSYILYLISKDIPTISIVFEETRRFSNLPVIDRIMKINYNKYHSAIQALTEPDIQHTLSVKSELKSYIDYEKNFFDEVSNLIISLVT